MSELVIALIAAVAAAVIGYFTGKRAGFGVERHDFTIHIQHKDETGYFSKTTPPQKKIKGGDFVFWKITQDKKLPADSLIYLEFPDGSCLVHQKPDDNKGGKDISSFAKFFQEKKSYAYKIYYLDSGGTSHLLEDPELIIEGDQPLVVHS